MQGKFYYLPPVYTPNTAATNRALSYIKGFSELGVDTNVLFFRPNQGKNKIPNKYKNICIKYYWDSFYFDLPFFRYISLLIYYICFLLTLKQGDVVYAYGHADIWNLILKFRKGVKIYVEYTEHPDVTGIGGRFLTPSMPVFYKNISKVDGLFVITTSLKKYYVSKGVPANKIHITNITIDPSRFENISKALNAEPYIAYCGTVSNTKDGVDLLIMAFKYVIERYPNIQLYIIGGAPLKSDSNIISHLVLKYALENNVRFLGHVEADLIPQILVNAAILALCRPDNLQAKNGFATKVGEYLLSRNPVVLTSVGDFPLFFKDTENALLVDSISPIEFANKILWALEHPVEAKHIGEKGYQTAIYEFHYRKVVSVTLRRMNLIK